MKIDNNISGIQQTHQHIQPEKPKNEQNVNEFQKSLSDKEKAEVQKLKRTDHRVKSHENAHKSSAGGLSASGPNYKYRVGPDGQRYAVAGDVQIDTSEVPNDPEATIKKAQQIRKAALAPADPSPQDIRVAMEAAQMEANARKELLEAKNEEKKTDKNFFKKESNSTYDSPNESSIFEIIV